MLMITKIDKPSCCVEKSMPCNFGILDLNTKVLRQGETKLSEKQIKDISFVLAHDLLEYAQNGGDMNNLSIKNVYAFLDNKLKQFSHDN